MNGDPPLFVLPLSADSPAALDELRGACATFLRAADAVTPGGLLRSAARRRPRQWRAVALASTLDDLATTLEGGVTGELVFREPPAQTPRRGAWITVGEGPAQPDAIRRLYRQVAPFRIFVDHLVEPLRRQVGVDLRELVIEGMHAAPDVKRAVDVACELGLAEIWRAAAPPPSRIGSRELGGLAALALAGALDTATAVAIASGRMDVSGVSPRPLVLDLVRGRDGELLPAGTQMRPDDVRDHAGSADDAGATAAADGMDYVIEIGCGQGSARNGGEAEPPPERIGLQDAGTDAPLALARALASIFCGGVTVDFSVLAEGDSGALVPLPAPPVASRRIWPDLPGPVLPPRAVTMTSALPEGAATPPRTAEAPRLADVLSVICEHTAQELGVALADVSPDATFIDMGADSLLMVNVVRQLEERFAVSVSMRELFELGDAPRLLARLVAERLGVENGTADPPAASPSSATTPTEPKALRFSLSYFGSYPRDTPVAECYEALFESARYADEAGFHALWVPERHFHAFGGIFPNPSVLAAALARETSRIRIHAGSVVLPLHDPIRVAEEWSVVDNLSGGRVGIGVASGWHANDFALRPDAFGRHRDLMYEGLETVRALWRGDEVAAVSGTGEQIAVRLHPMPFQPMPPFFTAVVSNAASWERAGRNGLGVVTNLMTQDVSQLAANVERYRQARIGAGFDPEEGDVVVLLHTYLAADRDRARAEAFEPFCAYLRSSLSLFGQATNSLGMKIDLERASEEDVTYLLERGFGGYCDGRALIGTVESCAAVVEQVAAAGADEIACFVDFGVSRTQLRASLPHVDELRRRFATTRAGRGGAPAQARSAQAPDWEGEFSPLSLAQERMWFSETLSGDRCGYNEPMAIRLEGPLDVAALEAALDDVVRAQPTLRCRIIPDGGMPRQRVLRHRQLALPVVEVAGDETEIVRREMTSESARCFDLSNGPLWLTRLLRFGPRHHVLFFSFHHIAIDMVSLRCLTRQLSRCYTARMHGEAPGLEAPTPYVQYARDQREAVGSPEVQAAIRRWEEHLTPLPEPLVVPTDRERPPIVTGEGGAHFHPLDPEVDAGLKALTRATRVTPFMCLATAYVVALHDWSGQQEIVIGTPIVDRPPQYEETIGPYINTLPVRVRVHPSEPFAHVLERVRGTMLDAIQYSAAPFEEIVRRLNPPREAGRNPIFQVMIEYGGGASHELDLPDVTATTLDVSARRSTFDLSLRLWPLGRSFRCQFEYATALFDHATITGFAGRFDTILRKALVDVQQPVEAILGAGARDAGRSSIEETVHEVWCSELSLAQIDPEASFFEVGGHSLNAVYVLDRINARYGVEFPIVEFFRRPTIRETAARLEQLAAETRALPRASGLADGDR